MFLAYRQKPKLKNHHCQKKKETPNKLFVKKLSINLLLGVDLPVVTIWPLQHTVGTRQPVLKSFYCQKAEVAKKKRLSYALLNKRSTFCEWFLSWQLVQDNCICLCMSQCSPSSPGLSLNVASIKMTCIFFNLRGKNITRLGYLHLLVYSPNAHNGNLEFGTQFQVSHGWQGPTGFSHHCCLSESALVWTWS